MGGDPAMMGSKLRLDNTLCGFIVAMLASLAPVASAAEPSTVLILQNVTPVQAGQDEDAARFVSVRIADGVVDLVTEDAIATGDGDRVYDARKAHVVGNLTPNQPATFLLIDGDPGQSPYLLLDTRRHASFAVYQGRVLRNRLQRINETRVVEEERASRGWLAYTPPPIALPSASDAPRWNQFDSDHVSGIFIGAMGMDRVNWLDQDDNSRSQVGNLNNFDGGEVRALRFGAVGRIKFDRPWVWTLFLASNAFDKGIDVEDIDDFRVYDARLDIPLTGDLTLSVGKQKEPISMERLMSLQYLPMQERPAFLDALLPARKVGAALSGAFLDERVTWAGGVYNSWLDKDNGGGIDDNPTSFTTRFTWMPFESRNRTTTLHLGSAFRYSNTRGGGAIAETPEFIEAPVFVETPLLDTDSLQQLQAEASYRTGPWFFHSEYLGSSLEGTAFGNLDFKGYQLTGAWTLTGEVRPYHHRTGSFDRLPVAKGVDLGGWGTLELATRFSHLDLSDGGLDGGEMDIWSLGFNWWLTSNASLGVNYRYIELDRFGIKGESHGLNGRLMLQID
jgi:phosphate-selective porin OprO/OprP